jgi:hypothetical protein
MRSALVDLAGVTGAVCLVRGAALLSDAAGWGVAGGLLLALWIAAVRK